MANHYRYIGPTRRQKFKMRLATLFACPGALFLRRPWRRKDGFVCVSGPVCMIEGQQRAWRRKKAVYCVVTLFLGGVLLVGGLRMARKALIAAGTFDIAEIMVYGNQVVTSAQVLEAAGLRIGDSMVAFSAAEIGGVVAERLPWVERAELKRDWPSTLVIEVKEFQRFALINLGRESRRQLYYLDQTGRAFALVGTSLEVDYPVITGDLQALGAANGLQPPGSPLAEAMRFIQLAKTGNVMLPLQFISEIQVSDKELILYLVNSPFPIHLGRGNMDGKYNRLVLVLGELYSGRQLKEIARIRMDYYDNRVLVARMEQ